MLLNMALLLNAMTSLKYKDYDIHYEVMGDHGDYLVVLNGIMMSIASWKPFYNVFDENNRVIYIDFVDQGLSSRMNEHYTQELQVEVVEAVLAHLEVETCCLMGISYGGEVAAQYVLKYPQRVNRLILANTASRTSPWLRDIGYGWNEVGQQADGKAYYYIAIPVVYSTQFYEKNLEWMRNREKLLMPLFNDQVIMDTFKRLVDSSENYDVLDQIDQITCPTLIISSVDDVLTPVHEQRLMSQKIKNSDWLVIQDCGHGSMYEKPNLFASLVTGFCAHGHKKIEV